MKVVMLKDVKGVGARGMVIETSDGFAMNSLIPSGKAVQATPQKIAEVERRIAGEKASSEAKAAQTAAHIKQLEGTQHSIGAKANEKGHLFKGIKKDEIAAKLGVPVECISGIDDVVRGTGEYKLSLAAHGAKATVILTIEAQK